MKIKQVVEYDFVKIQKIHWNFKYMTKYLKKMKK